MRHIDTYLRHIDTHWRHIDTYWRNIGQSVRLGPDFRRNERWFFMYWELYWYVLVRNSSK